MTAIPFFLKEVAALGVGVLENEPMSRHTSFRIGGPAAALLLPPSAASIPAVLRCARRHEVPLFILGNGTNLLVSDRGLDCAVLKTAGAASDVRDCGDGVLEAEAGASLARVCAAAGRAGLSGMEGLQGIPGSVGGGVYMNAGAYGYEMRQVVVQTEYCDGDGTPHLLEGDAHRFENRRSFFTERPDAVILRTRFRLRSGDRDEILRRTDELLESRREKQPLEYPSAGSVFKRPPGMYAGRLIDECGLRGCAVGGAQVSEKHAGFIINRGGATCDDVLRLIGHIRSEVFRRFGVELECEIRIVGENAV